MTWNGKEMTRNKANKATEDYLRAHGIAVRATPSRFALTHQKTLIVDNEKAVIMTFNLVKKYYKTGRDFGMVDTDANDVATIEKVFNADWQNTEILPTVNDLVWSPDSRDALVALIKSAQKYLLIYNEEMADDDIERALKDASDRGVKVLIVMTYSPSWREAFQSLVASGAQIRTFSAKDKHLYIHAKMILADGTLAFLGSENFSAPSLEKNRELGIIFSNPEIIQKLEATFATDWTGAKPFANME